MAVLFRHLFAEGEKLPLIRRRDARAQRPDQMLDQFLRFLRLDLPAQAHAAEPLGIIRQLVFQLVDAHQPDGAERLVKQIAEPLQRRAVQLVRVIHHDQPAAARQLFQDVIHARRPVIVAALDRLEDAAHHRVLILQPLPRAHEDRQRIVGRVVIHAPRLRHARLAQDNADVRSLADVFQRGGHFLDRDGLDGVHARHFPAEFVADEIVHRLFQLHQVAGVFDALRCQVLADHAGTVAQLRCQFGVAQFVRALAPLFDQRQQAFAGR